MGFELVADVVRHLKTQDFASVSSDFGILTNSATRKLNCAEARGFFVMDYQVTLLCMRTLLT
jgi:hypothetical protein